MSMSTTLASNSYHSKYVWFNNDPDLLQKTITADESWVYGYDIETKAQSSQWSKSQDRKKHVKFSQI